MTPEKRVLARLRELGAIPESQRDIPWKIAYREICAADRIYRAIKSGRQETMKYEARTVLRILARNQRTRNTGKWKAYMIMPQAVHEYHCPATRFGQKRGSCKCGAGPLQKEFEQAWKKFTAAVRRAT